MDRTRKPPRDETWAFFALADFLALLAAYYGTVLIRFYSAWGGRMFALLNRLLGVREGSEVGDTIEAYYLIHAPRLIVILAVVLGVFYALRYLYAGWRFVRPRSTAWNVLVANAWALGVFYAYFYLTRNVFHPRSFFFTVLALNTILCTAFRALLARGLEWVRHRWGWGRRSALLVGEGPAADMLYGYIQVVHPHGIEIAGRLPGAATLTPDLANAISRAVTQNHMHLLIAAEKRFRVADFMRLLEIADSLDLPVKVLSDQLDVIMHRARLPVDVIHGLPLVHFDAPSTTAHFDRIRRHVSVLAAVVGLVVAAPLLGLIAILIAATSPGGVWFVQERIGVNRKPFRIIKFRTMRHRAEEEQAVLEEFNEAGKALFKIRRDPRVTPVGRFLRRFSLDELPQLLNVIKGDMLLVGPRPLPRRDYEHYYEEWHYSRHAGLPGLTCLWQVSGRSDLDFHDMCVLDVYYLRNRSWVLDLQILLRTLAVVLFGRGAY